MSASNRLSSTSLNLSATESEHGWAVARLETCASLRAFGSIPTLSSVEAERGGTARRLESGRDLRVWGSCPPASAWKVNAAGPRAVSKADGALGLGVRFTRLPRRVARTVRGRFAKPKPVVMSPEQVQLLHSPPIFLPSPWWNGNHASLRSSKCRFDSGRGHQGGIGQRQASRPSTW
jgi:hypothetical protein